MYDTSGGGKANWSVRNSHIELLMTDYPRYKQMLKCLTDDEDASNVKGSHWLSDRQRRSLTVYFLWALSHR